VLAHPGVGALWEGHVIENLPTAAWLVAPVDESYPVSGAITVIPPRQLAALLRADG